MFTRLFIFLAFAIVTQAVPHDYYDYNHQHGWDQSHQQGWQQGHDHGWDPNHGWNHDHGLVWDHDRGHNWDQGHEHGWDPIHGWNIFQRVPIIQDVSELLKQAEHYVDKIRIPSIFDEHVEEVTPKLEQHVDKETVANVEDNGKNISPADENVHVNEKNIGQADNIGEEQTNIDIPNKEDQIVEVGDDANEKNVGQAENIGEAQTNIDIPNKKDQTVDDNVNLNEKNIGQVENVGEEQTNIDIPNKEAQIVEEVDGDVNEGNPGAINVRAGPETPASYRHKRSPEEIESRWGGGRHGGFSAGQSGHHLASSSIGQTLNAERGNQYYNDEEASRIAASKSSSSGSSKKSKTKSETVFGGGASSYDNDSYLNKDSNYYNLGLNKNVNIGGGVLGGFIPGISSSSNVNLGLGGSSIAAGSQTKARESYFGGQTKTEVDQQESNHQSNHESFEADHNRRVNAGAGYDKLNSNYHQNHYNEDAGNQYIFS